MHKKYIICGMLATVLLTGCDFNLADLFTPKDNDKETGETDDNLDNRGENEGENDSETNIEEGNYGTTITREKFESYRNIIKNQGCSLETNYYEGYQTLEMYKRNAFHIESNVYSNETYDGSSNKARAIDKVHNEGESEYENEVFAINNNVWFRDTNENYYELMTSDGYITDGMFLLGEIFSWLYEDFFSIDFDSFSYNPEKHLYSNVIQPEPDNFLIDEESGYYYYLTEEERIMYLENQYYGFSFKVENNEINYIKFEDIAGNHPGYRPVRLEFYVCEININFGPQNIICPIEKDTYYEISFDIVGKNKTYSYLYLEGTKGSDVYYPTKPPFDFDPSIYISCSLRLEEGTEIKDVTENMSYHLVLEYVYTEKWLAYLKTYEFAIDIASRFQNNGWSNEDDDSNSFNEFKEYDTLFLRYRMDVDELGDLESINEEIINFIFKNRESESLKNNLGLTVLKENQLYESEFQTESFKISITFNIYKYSSGGYEVSLNVKIKYLPYE